MEILNKKKLFLLVLIFLILVFGFFSVYKFNKNPKITAINPTYSSNTTESKNLLVPDDFPFPQGLKADEEFQREINDLLEYTVIWASSLPIEENQEIFFSYMKNNGWDPFVMEMGLDAVSLSGTKDKVGLNIFIGKNSTNSKNEVQIHFSQNKK